MEKTVPLAFYVLMCDPQGSETNDDSVIFARPVSRCDSESMSIECLGQYSIGTLSYM